jgi:hypothetical protein
MVKGGPERTLFCHFVLKMDSSEWENNNYDPDDVGPRSPQLQPMRIHLLASRSPSPDIYEDVSLLLHGVEGIVFPYFFAVFYI